MTLVGTSICTHRGLEIDEHDHARPRGALVVIGQWVVPRDPTRVTAQASNACDDEIVPVIEFRPLRVDDFPQLVEWFAEPAVARWWNQPADLTFVHAKYGPRIEGREPTAMWIVDIDGASGGLLQNYRHVDYPEHDSSVGVPDAVGIDYLIGEAHHGRGLGGPVLRAFAAHSLELHPSMTTCVATPAQANTASWRSLERAGFSRYGQCRPPHEPIAFIYGLTRSELDDPNIVDDSPSR
jgi:aminoglycoside 6'-N-acetyltransferase